MNHDSFFLEQETSQGRRKKDCRRFFAIVFIVVVLLTGFLVIWTTVNVCLATASLFDGRDRLMAAKAEVEVYDFDSAQISLDKAEVNFNQAGRYLRRVGWLKVLPWLGPQIEVGQSLLDFSSDFFEMIETVADLGADVSRLLGRTSEAWAGAEEFLPLKYDDLSPATKSLILKRINGAAPDLALAAEQARFLKEQLDDLGEAPEPTGTALRGLDSLLSKTSSALSLASVGSRLLPAFAGLDSEKKFLLLLENNTELRPAGGFIGTYGILRVKDGEINELEIKDSYLLDLAAAPYYSLEPPAPLKRYLSAGGWYFRDSNWSPDFPTAARQAVSMFTNEVLAIPAEQRGSVQGQMSFDGVIAFTPDFVADLLRITGPLEVGGQVFSADNVTDTLEYEVELGFRENGTPYEQRKDIITDLLNEMKARFFNIPFVEWGPFLSAINDNLTEKQLVLFSGSSTESEEVIKGVNWGGIFNAGSGDFLMVVDANLASLKTDPKVVRDISYSIRPAENGRFIGKAIIRYDHQGEFDWKTTRYRTYTRVYVPLGSELIQGEGMMADDKLKNPSGAAGAVDVGQELGVMVFGAFISVEPGESGELSFEYYLPSSIQAAVTAGDYSLQVSKQIGAAGHGLTLYLDFGKKVAGASPAEEKLERGDKSYRVETVLDTDRRFSVWF